MLRFDSRNFNFNGGSVTEEGAICAMFSAGYNDGRLYINMNIEDVDTYVANKDAVDADYDAFVTAVTTSITAATASAADDQ